MSEALRRLENGESDLSLSTGVDDISSRWRLMHRAGESSFSYRHPVVSQVVVLSDAMCVFLAVVACIAWQRIFDTPELSGALLLANVMAGGAFFLFPKNVPLLDIPDITRLSFQLRYLAPPVVFGLIVFCAILVMLSWPVGVAVRMGAEWLAFVAVALAAERIIGTYVLHTEAMAHRLTRKVAIIGSGAEATQMAARINTRMQRMFRLVGIFDDQGANVDGTIDELVQRGREDGIDAVIMSFPPRRGRAAACDGRAVAAARRAGRCVCRAHAHDGGLSLLARRALRAIFAHGPAAAPPERMGHAGKACV